MLGIKELHAGQERAYAVVFDGVRDYRVEIEHKDNGAFLSTI